jgi:hypothetical protein
MSEQQAKRREELQRRKEQASAQRWDPHHLFQGWLYKNQHPQRLWEEEILSGRSEGQEV